MFLEQLLFICFTLLAAAGASRTLAQGWLIAGHLKCTVLNTLYDRGLLFQLELSTLTRSTLCTASQWDKLILEASDTVPDWFAKLMTCPVCQCVHLTGLASLGVCLLLPLLVEPPGWSWVKTVLTWVLCYISLPSSTLAAVKKS